MCTTSLHIDNSVYCISISIYFRIPSYQSIHNRRALLTRGAPTNSKYIISLSLSLYIYIYIMHVSVCVYLSLSLSLHLSLSIYIYTYIRIYIYLFIFIYLYTYEIPLQAAAAHARPVRLLRVWEREIPIN